MSVCVWEGEKEREGRRERDECSRGEVTQTGVRHPDVSTSPGGAWGQGVVLSSRLGQDDEWVHPSS